MRRVRTSPALLLGAAAAAAGVQLATAVALGAPDYLAALALGWAAAIAVARGRGAPAGPAPRALEVAAGALVALAACAAAVAARDAYRPFHRLLPLVAGAGLACAAAGVRGTPRHGRELALLALPLLYPLPAAVRLLLAPTRETAAAAASLLALAGVSVRREGTLLHLPELTMEVVEDCSGLHVIAQLLVLAVLVACLFPTRPRQNAALAAVAIAVGFAVNAARVATLTLIARGAPEALPAWHQTGPAGALFPVIATALAGLAWTAVLRARPLQAAAARPTRERLP